MADYKLKIQKFRTNDLIDNGGKQFEMGKGWCEDFFGINSNVKEITLFLIFKPLNSSHKSLDGTQIELCLSEVNSRGDRKAYANTETGGNSQIKDFFINKLNLNVENNLSDYFAFYKLNANNYLLFYVPELLYNNFIKLFNDDIPPISVKQTPSEINSNVTVLQQILFGAPGTGKSHTIKNDANITEQNSIRTTFHPDSDYSTFVGCYKPTKVDDSNDITYKFSPQSFIKAYVAAWKDISKPYYLIIEEINRGNCAQIFGDIFQLLDRNSSGCSTYAINADDDIAKFLKEDTKGFASLSEEQHDAIAAFELVNDKGERQAVGEKILDGTILLLPPNLHIWATMNTSDQSLFPIDSAFKRRWDWRYIPIDYTDRGHYIACGGTQYSWADFLQKVNDKVESVTQSEDKKLGYWFMGNGAEQTEITIDRFVSKVVFYLWNDVFKDFGRSGNTIFKDSFAKFHLFFDYSGKPKVNVVKAFLDALEVKSGEIEAGVPEEGTQKNGIDYTKYSFDGEKKLSKKALGEKIVLKYLEQNPNLSFEQIRNIFTFDNTVESPYQYKGIIAKLEDITDERIYGTEKTSSDGVKFKILTWWNKYNINFIIKFAESQGWSVTEEQK